MWTRWVVLLALAVLAGASLPGLDVSSWQGNVDWTAVKNNGAKFAYVKATEGVDYHNPKFNQQYEGSYNVGLIRGAYHFLRPDVSTGAAQADYFASHGGGWSKDGQTLPGAVDLEDNGNGQCYGLSTSAYRNFVNDFITRYHARTSRWPVIYTTRSYWNTCTGSWTGAAANCPLWLASWSSSPGSKPAGWSYHTFWQFADKGTFPGDQDSWNGDAAGLQKMACDGAC